MKKIDAPCFNCADRELGCHSNCDKYKEYKDSKDSRRNQLNEIKSAEIHIEKAIGNVRYKYRKKKT